MIRGLLRRFVDLPATVIRVWAEIWRELWTRVVIMGLLAILALLLTQLTTGLVPDGWAASVNGSATDKLLSIIANAMLAVTTFSLTVMVTVFRSSSSQFTPRLHRMIVQDDVTQKTLAAFIGAYVYSVLGTAMRELGFYPDDQSFMLFAMTVVVLVYVVVSIIRWVLHLQTFGSLVQTSREVEDVTRKRLRERMDAPCLGGHCWPRDSKVPNGAKPVGAKVTGYVSGIHQSELNTAAEHAGFDLYIAAEVGHFALEGETIVYLVDRGEGDDEGDKDDLLQAITDHIVISELRNYDQDPRFGLIVLGEIASRALSPGINDPGTAIDIIGRQARILADYRGEAPKEETPHDRLWVHPLDPDELVEDAYAALARDGAGLVEVQIRLQKTLASLIAQASPEMADALTRAAEDYCRRARAALEHPADLRQLEAATGEDIWSAAA